VKLLIAPEGTHSDYATTINALGVTEADLRFQVLGNGSKPGRSAFSDLGMGIPGWYAVTPQLFTRADWGQYTFDFCVADEAHQILSPGTKGYYKAVGRVGPKGGTRGGVKAGAKLAMSGTPVRNKFENWYGVARFLWSDRNGPGDIADAMRTRWLEDNMDSEYDRFAYGNKRFTVEKFPGSFVNRLPAVIQHYRRGRCCEWHPEGFLADLKEPQVFSETIHLAPAQTKAIKELEEKYVTWLKDNPLVVSLPITLQQRIRQLTLGVPTVTPNDDGTSDVDFADDCVSPKMNRAIEIVSELPDDEAVVVFTSSRKFARVATQRFNAAGMYALELSGAIKNADREFAKRELNEGKLRVLVVVIAAGGTGISLQRRAATEIWLDSDVDMTNNEQAKARTDRLGQNRQVQRWYLRDEMGYDQGRFDSHITKQLQLNASNRRTA